jgi:hypothetical protein
MNISFRADLAGSSIFVNNDVPNLFNVFIDHKQAAFEQHSSTNCALELAMRRVVALLKKPVTFYKGAHFCA